MDIFLTGFATLLVVSALFYIVFAAFVFYWHLKKASIAVVPMILTFEIFWRSFIWLVVVSLILYYGPIIIKFVGI